MRVPGSGRVARVLGRRCGLVYCREFSAAVVKMKFRTVQMGAIGFVLSVAIDCLLKHQFFKAGILIAMIGITLGLIRD